MLYTCPSFLKRRLIVAIIALIAAAFMAAALGYAYLKHLKKQARNQRAKQQEKAKKKYAPRDLGIPDALVKEFEEWERYCEENGIDPRPMSTTEEKELINKITEDLAEYWKSLRSLSELNVNDIIRAEWFEHGLKMRWWEGDKAGDMVRETWYSYRIPQMLTDGQTGVHTRPDISSGNATDAARSTALFVVEEKAPPENWKHKSLPTTDDLVKIIARRLHDNGTYNPNGELLAIGEDLWSKTPAKVELVGQMNSERTSIIRAKER